AGASNLFSVELGHHAQEVSPLGQAVSVATMAAVRDVGRLKRRTHADSRRLLADRKVRRRAHLLFVFLQLRQRFLRAADPYHIAQEADPLVSYHVRLPPPWGSATCLRGSAPAPPDQPLHVLRLRPFGRTNGRILAGWGWASQGLRGGRTGPGSPL